MLKICIAIGLIIAGFLGYVALQPADYLISREILISAPAEKIFPHINGSKAMNAWSPWVELDPKAVMTYSGPDSGVGSKTNWEGGEQLGKGSALIVESVPNKSVRTKLEYVEPFEGTQDAEMSITPSDKDNIVKWSVQGKNNFMGRLFCFFMNMDKKVGDTFDKGLMKLKNVVETSK